MFIIHCQTERNKSKIYSNGIWILKLFWYFFYNKKSKTYIWFLEINIYKISIKRNKIIKKVSKQKTKNCFFRALKNCSFYTVMLVQSTRSRASPLHARASPLIVTRRVTMVPRRGTIKRFAVKIFDFKSMQGLLVSLIEDFKCPWSSPFGWPWSPKGC